MKSLYLLIFFLVFSTSGFSQKPSCTDVVDFVKSEGYQVKSLPGYILNSTWLSEVTAYSYKYKIYVVAKIKRNEYDFSPSSYVFCGIPQQNWNAFSSMYTTDKSYGERFHTYIMDYTCDCG